MTRRNACGAAPVGIPGDLPGRSQPIARIGLHNTKKGARVAVSARSASWVIPADRAASAVWLGIIWFGMIVGFGLDFPTFLHKQPPAAGILYVHAAVFVGWLVLVTVQVAFVLRGRLRQHRRLGSKAGYVALLMVPLGIATGLTTVAQGRDPPGLLALNLVDLLGFITFVAIGLRYRGHPAAHKRLMMLAMISIADPGFARITKHLLTHPGTPLAWFMHVFYGNVLLLVAMFGWDLWRRRRVHPALLAGGMSLIGAELLTAFLFFNGTWAAMATGLARVWGYTGGMP